VSKHSNFFQSGRCTLTDGLKVLSGVCDYVSRKRDELRRLYIRRGTHSQDGIHCFDTFLPRVRIAAYLLHHLMFTYDGAGTHILTGYLLRKVYYNVLTHVIAC
jgi:hypothetical protein